MGRVPPFRLTMPEQPEAVLQEQCVRALDMLLAPPAFFFSAAIGATQLTAQQAAALSRAGVKRGIPDLIFVFDGRLFLIELKLAKGRLSTTKIVSTRRGSPRVLVGQVERFAELEAAGAMVAIARSVEDVLAQLEAWGVPLRGRVAKRLPRADEIHDPDFTGGLESAEYVRRLRDGTLP
jgi:hypothetical protein